MRLQARKKGNRKPEIILIVSEDTKSSTFYLKDKIKSLGIPCKINFKKLPVTKTSFNVTGSIRGSAPISVVEYAVIEKNKFNKEQKRKDSFPYSEVYCVMDVDNHTSLDRALQLIEKENKQNKQSKIISIISNECFEVWYVLHFRYTTGALHRKSRKRKTKHIPKDKNISKILEKHLDIKEYDKADNIFGLLNEKGDENKAVERAVKLNKHHLNCNNISENEVYKYNPSTQIHKLIQTINKIGNKKKELKFEPLTEKELKNFLTFYPNENFIKEIWKLIHSEFQTENYKNCLFFLKECLHKPSSCFVYKNPKIRNYINKNYWN